MIKVQSRFLTKGTGEKLQEESCCEASRVRSSVSLTSFAKRVVLAFPLQGRWSSGKEEIMGAFLVSDTDRRHR